MIALLALTVVLQNAAVVTPKPRVYAGVYLTDVSGFDLKEGRFKAEIQLWCKWSGDATVPPLVIANAEIEKQDELSSEHDGTWHSVRWRVQGTFRGTFPLHRFPFDTQRLLVELELPDDKGTLVPDLAGSGMASKFSITGWLYQPYFAAQVRSAKYASDLGSIAREGKPHVVNAVAFVLVLERPVAAYVLRFMLPLAIILMMALMAFFLPADQLEVRAGIGVTALLSCIAFHFSQADTLPNVSYLVVADKLFLGSYVLILLALVGSVVSFHLFGRNERASRRLDRVAYAALPALAIISSLVILAGTARDAPAADVKPPVVQPSKSIKPELRVAISALNALNTGGITNLHRRGLTYPIDGNQRAPHLAERMPDMTNDLVRFLPDGGMRVRWRLRPGLKWSDGSTLDAQDVAFSAGIFDNPDRVAIETVDARTVDVTYKDRAPDHLRGFGVYPKRDLEALVKQGGSEAVVERYKTDPAPGDGPYMIESFVPKQRVVLRRNPHFAGPPPAIERIVFVVPAGKASEALLKGEIDLASFLDRAGYEALDARAGIVTKSGPSEDLEFIQPDISIAPFSDLRVRQAILHAIDREALVDRLDGANGRVAHGYRTEAADDYAADVVRYPHDPARARALLVEAGLGSPTPIKLTAQETKPDSQRATEIAAIKEALEAVGFVVEIQYIPSTLASYQSGSHGSLLLFNRATDVTARFWNVPTVKSVYGTRQPNRLFDAEVFPLYWAMEKTLFEERRRSLSIQLQKEWSERLPVLPLFFTTEHWAHVAALKGYAPQASTNPWWNVEHLRFE